MQRLRYMLGHEHHQETLLLRRGQSPKIYAGVCSEPFEELGAERSLGEFAELRIPPEILADKGLHEWGQFG